MNIQLRVAGPTWHFSGTAGGGTLEFLGNCDGDTQVNITILRRGIVTDASGEMMNFDRQWMGIGFTASGVFSWYDEAVFLKHLSGLPGFNGNFQGNNFSAGQIPLQSLGALDVLEGAGCRYLLYCPYSNLTVFSDMIKAFNCPIAAMNGPVGTSLSTRVKRNSFVVEALPLWTINNNGVSGVVWNQDFSGMPTFQVTNQLGH